MFFFTKLAATVGKLTLAQGVAIGAAVVTTTALGAAAYNYKSILGWINTNETPMTKAHKKLAKQTEAMEKCIQAANEEEAKLVKAQSEEQAQLEKQVFAQAQARAKAQAALNAAKNPQSFPRESHAEILPGNS